METEVFEFHDANHCNTVVAMRSMDPAKREVHLAAATCGAFTGNGAERCYFQILIEGLDAPARSSGEP